MKHVTDKKEFEGVCRLQEKLQIVKEKNIEPESVQNCKNLAIAMLWCITQW